MPGIGNTAPPAALLNIQQVQSQPAQTTVEVEDQPSPGMAPLELTLTPPSQNADDPQCIANANNTRQVARDGQSAGAMPAAPSRAGFTQAKLDSAGESAAAARAVGVDLTKAAFIKSCCNVALKAVVVGIAAVLTVTSVGGAAPLLALASASMAVSACDAVCAYRNFKNADAQAQGAPPPYGQLRYNNAVMNLAHSLATACGASEGAAGNWAKAATFVVGGGLATATFLMSLGMTEIPDALLLANDCISGVRTAYYLVAAAVEMHATAGNVAAVQGNLGEVEEALAGIMQDDRFLALDDPLSEPQLAAAHQELLALMNSDAENEVARGTSLQGTTGKIIAGTCMSLGLTALIPGVSEFGMDVLKSGVDLLQV